MKNWKRLGTACLTLVMMLSAVGCTKEEEKTHTPYEVKALTFAEFVEKMPQEFISDDDMNINFTFVDPEKFGFDEKLLVLPTSSKKDSETGSQQAKDLLTQLKKFDYKKLSDDEKITYDILKDTLKQASQSSKYYYLDNNYLGSFVGFQAQLPLLLVEFNFESKHDLDSYFNILKTSEKTFKTYAKYEKERQDNKVGMPKVILNKVIEQCENFTKEDPIFLVADNNARIDQLTFLSDEEKADAKAKNEEYVNVNLRNAYDTLGKELKKLVDTASDKDDGLSSLPDGKDYYEYLFKQSTGTDMSVKEAKKYLEKKQSDAISKMTGLMMLHPELMNQLESQPIYTDKTTFTDTLDYLGSVMSQDFPAVDALNYQVHQVPDSMKDNFSPAAYLTSRIDAPITSNEVMYFNGDFESSLFGTIAHEGYPGHMYQNVYFKSLKEPTVRYLVNYQGYSEGWATYVEEYVNKYAVGDQNLIQLWHLNNDVTKAMIGLYDIAIHYEGMTREDFRKDFKENFNSEIDDATLDEQYDLILETPANYNAYYVGYFQFQDLYEKAKSKLGTKFNAVDFHAALLKSGPAPFSVVEKQVDAYIKATK